VTAFAVRHVRNILGAAETSFEKVVDQRKRLIVGQMREQFAFETARQIGAGLGSRDIEFRKMLLLFRHVSATPKRRTLTGSLARIVSGMRSNDTHHRAMQSRPSMGLTLSEPGWQPVG
jgi:hypothetical protein